jgi:HTH-type transcriptional regulator/antitoxin HigA
MINQANPDATRFNPDWVSPPGDTILDLLEEREWNQNQLAERLGFSIKHVNQLIKDNVPLTENIAIRLESVLGAPLGFWLKREAQYRERTVLPNVGELHAGRLQHEQLIPFNRMNDLKVNIAFTKEFRHDE